MRASVKFDYSKLLGKIKENGYTQSEFAAELGKGYFRQPETIKMCDMLGIAYKDISLYFFTQKV